MTPGAETSGQAGKKLIGFGGTGKAVALIYAKVGRLLGETPSILVVDFPASDDPNSQDGRLDSDLRSEGFGDEYRINTLPETWVAAPRSLIEHLGLEKDIADALLTDQQQRTPPSEGLNQEPQVGATIARLKIARDWDTVRSKALTAGQDEIFLVAGLGGGTGTGMTPCFARALKSESPNCRLHGVFLLPWQDIGEEQVGNAGQRRNAASLLRYLKQHHDNLFHSTLILGGFPGLENAKAGERVLPIHPTLILAALYVHMWHAWGGGAQLTSRLHRLETVTSGIRPDEITGAQGTLGEMLCCSRAAAQLLETLADQHPDEVLRWFSLWPLCSPLAWPHTRTLLKKYCKVSGRPLGAGWMDVRDRLRDTARLWRDRLQWIENLLSDERVFDFDPNQIERRGSSIYRAAEEAARKDDEYKEFRIRDIQRSLEEVVRFFENLADRASRKPVRNGGTAPTVGRDTRVWLPLNYPGAAEGTQFTALDPEHLEQLSEFYERDVEKLVAPEFLGVRQMFRWRLEKALQQGHGRALEDFALLVEGLIYGLLVPETHDLNAAGLGSDFPEDRFLTVLKFHAAPGARGTVAGSFDPDTLVTPAANWHDKHNLARRVQELRFTVGPRARGLLEAFTRAFQAPEMPWYKAVTCLIHKYGAGPPEPDCNQRNEGPLYLRLHPGASPMLVFLPQFREGWLARLATVLGSVQYASDHEKTSLTIDDRPVGRIRRFLPRDNPKLYGLGVVVELAEIPGGQAPYTNWLNEQPYLEAIQPVIHNYPAELELPEEQRRYRIPDTLRVAFYVWGPIAYGRLLPGRRPYVYGREGAGLDPHPHDQPGAKDPGLHKGDTFYFYVSRTRDGRLAYHVERYGGQHIGELSRLGYALWRIFCGDRSEDLIAESDGWIGLNDRLAPQAPNLTNEVLNWSCFLDYVAQRPDGLFPEAARAYIEKHSRADVRPRRNSDLKQIEISGQQWARLPSP